MNSTRSKASSILDGVGACFLTFMGIEAGGLALAVIIRVVEKYTGWSYLGEDQDYWLGGILMYWAALRQSSLG